MAYKFTPTQGPLAPFLQTLGSGLEQVAQAKLGQLQENQLLNSLRSAGAPAENIELFRALKGQPELQKNILQNPGFFGQQAAAPEAAINSMEPTQQQVQQPSNVQNLLKNPATRHQEEQERIAREQLELSKKKDIREENKPFSEEMRAEAKWAREAKPLGLEIAELMDRPDIMWGEIKSLTPTRFMNAATQALVSKLAKLVLYEAKEGKGVPSKLRLQLEDLSKPQIYQKPEAAKYLINSFNNKVNNILSKENIADQLININKGEPPRFKQEVDKYYKKYKTLEPASNYPDGTIAEDGKIKFITKDGEWEIYGI